MCFQLRPRFFFFCAICFVCFVLLCFGVQHTCLFCLWRVYRRFRADPTFGMTAPPLTGKQCKLSFLFVGVQPMAAVLLCVSCRERTNLFTCFCHVDEFSS